MFCRNSSLQAVCDTPIARITGCVIIKDIGRRLTLQLQCTYQRQGQQGDVRQSVRYNIYKHTSGVQNVVVVLT